jgi:hypothetical protein
MLQLLVNKSISVPIQIAFPTATNEFGWVYPECIRALDFHAFPTIRNTEYFDDSPSPPMEWTTRGSSLIGLNQSHATCQFTVDSDELSGIFALQIKPDSGALIKFALANQLPYTAPLSAAFALFLCLLALLATLVRAGVQMRLIRFAFVLSFILSSAVLFLLQRVAMNSVGFWEKLKKAKCFVGFLDSFLH